MVLFLVLLPNCTCQNHKYFLRPCTTAFFWCTELKVLSVTHPSAFLRAPLSWWGTVLPGAWQEPGAEHTPSQEWAGAAAASCPVCPELPQPLLSQSSVLGTNYRGRNNEPVPGLPLLNELLFHSTQKVAMAPSVLWLLHELKSCCWVAVLIP